MKRKGFKQYFNVLFLIMISLSVFLLAEPAIHVMKQAGTATPSPKTKKKVTIVLDAGHGGMDPGKVGVNGALEKDINLSITLKLKKLLEQNDIEVIMTRSDDSGLYSSGDSNKKSADMRKRVEIINNSNAVLAVSIHQNSFTQESIKGAQVFYYTSSDTGKEFAEIMQDQIKKSIQDGNKRVAKANDSYYMLRKTNCPIVIVECGYLSNYAEAALLTDEKYQDKMAWAIHLGLISYLNNLLDK
ncbi:N-acetylmuramoyl-L-alanine amidase [Anaerocolumna sedimenticola]|uniref:N-acetylmuramoyl-L-alanine amidase n=1 Tax=Anaerocolumna sedimenticola TaxID=2696063 RepID=A0A6P1TJ10_9FIRM|nr:N-acetylmuramoyl-L-alanine amidase [Anaerocolumna sedimenticola]QHQ60082.1 N-acetylmuramoyl-L-alanine amidase [Anaerocolumna sedimenticola]